MGISIVIPCLNEEKYIAECVLSLLNNGFNQAMLEILVVDGGSTDATLEILAKIQKQYYQVRIIHNPKRKTPFALNLGVFHASQAFILIAGAHAVYPDGYLTGLYALIQTQGIDVVGGAIETKVKNQTATSKAIAFVLSHPLGVGNSQFRIGANHLIKVDTVPFGLYKKEVFATAGLYNEKLIRNHDIELSKRILSKGFYIWLEPSLKVIYYARDTYSGLAKNNYGNGFWNLKTLFITRKFGSLSLRHYIPMFFILSIILPLLMSLFIKWFSVVAIFSVWLYITVLMYVSVKHSNQFNPIRVFTALVMLHVSYGWGSLMGMISGLAFWKK